MDRPATLAPAPPRSALRSLGLHLFALAFALLGGVLGIIGAFLAEMQSGGFLLVAIVGAPVIEEAMKPAGVYLLLIKWPAAVRGRLHTAVLAAISGLSFGVIEALVYVKLYVPDAPHWFVVYRFTAPLAIHTASSFVYGLGIDRRVIDWTQGRLPLPKRTRNLYITAAAMHGIFNTIAMALAIAGVLNPS